MFPKSNPTELLRLITACLHSWAKLRPRLWGSDIKPYITLTLSPKRRGPLSLCQRSYLFIITSFLPVALAIASDDRPVLVPIPSIWVQNNVCTIWNILQTYTATPVDPSVLNELSGYTFFNWKDHFHYTGKPNDGMGEWFRGNMSPIYPLTGSPRDKLDIINRAIFGTDSPAPGQTKMITNNHIGECATSAGLRECVGVFVGTSSETQRSREPTTFPFGVCIGIPPVGVTCSFDTDNVSIDLGLGGVGDRSGSSSISVSCSRPVVYRVSVLEHSPDPVGLTVRDVTIEGGPSPYLSSGVNSHESLSVAVAASTTTEGYYATQRILRIDIP